MDPLTNETDHELPKKLRFLDKVDEFAPTTLGLKLLS